MDLLSEDLPLESLKKEQLPNPVAERKVTVGGPETQSNGNDVQDDGAFDDAAFDDAAFDDGANDDDEPSLPPEATEAIGKKRSDGDAFQLWLEKNSEMVNRMAKQPKDTEEKSAAWLFRDIEADKKIIESPREYQTELFERAKKKNIIAVLDTGSGKTLIAALLLRHIIEIELEDRAHGDAKRISFFLVDKVALVFQQHAVLECNLGQPVEKLCGDMVDQKWSDKEFWDKTFADNMVIVCTAAILQQCLHTSYIQMEQINLLIFDEAHHAKKDHTYARIIKDFYCRAEKKPKIFGMTASPVDAQVDVRRAAEELEGLLQSEIATVANPAVLHQTVCKPKSEKVVIYRPPHFPLKTELTQKLSELVGRHHQFRKRFAFAQYALSELGPWCVDRFWKLVFKAERLAKLEAGTERSFESHSGLSSSLSAEVTALREAAEAVVAYELAEPSSVLLSDKVRQLHETLSKHLGASGGEQMRCIVFVDQRFTAMVLSDLFQQTSVSIPNLRVSTLMGGDGTDLGNASIRQQLLAITKFKKGELNCLFATSVAEEGLDIPDCNVIVRFDLYKTMIQYIQSRGRARQDESVYIHMIEAGNPEHQRRLYVNRRSEELLRQFCLALPEDRKLEGNNFNMEYFLRRERHKRRYTVPSTKAVLTYASSLVVLADFAASLPHPPEIMPTAEYTVMNVADGFVCEVLLPESSPIRTVVGKVHSTKQLAKCAAAFEMCLELLKKDYLTHHLKPIFTKQLPAMRNARLALSSKKKGQYKMRLKPELWSMLGTPTQLFATVLKLSSPEAMYRASCPLMLLTRQPIPKLSNFPLFFGKGRVSDVELVPLATPLEPTETQLQSLTNCFQRIFMDIFSKWYEAGPADVPYFLAPAAKGHGFAFDEGLDASAIIDWAGIDLMRGAERIPYTGKEDDAFFKDKFVADPTDGSRKFFLHGVQRSLTPLSPVPEGVPPPPHRAWKAKTCKHDILNYSVSLWSGARDKYTWREHDPVAVVEQPSLRRNLLDERVFEEELEDQTCYVVLEPLRISPLPVDVVAMAYNFPAIIHRIESGLIALDACKMLGLNNIQPDLALEALTKDSDNSGDDNNETRLNFQGGMGRNYERLELLGDSFLKMATTISLYTLIPDKDEFEYHVERMCLVCNKNLFNSALELNLEEYVRSREFTRRGWYPATIQAPVEAASEAPNEAVAEASGKTTGILSGTPLDTPIDTPVDTPVNTPVESPTEGTSAEGRTEEREDERMEERQYGLVQTWGKKNTAREAHVLGDKSIADVCEAFIGAAYLTTYPHSFDLAVQAVTAVVRNEKHAVSSYAEYYAAYRMPEWQTAPATPLQLEMAKQIAAQMDYTFTHPRLLRCAFLHPSYPRIYERLPSYQRLEFLGDALFDMVAVDFLFHRFPDKDPQWLTEHKMAMVSNQFLGALAVDLGFHRHLVSLSGIIDRQVREWTTLIKVARADAEAEAVAAGGTPADFARDYWVHVVAPPKCLPDVLEAYLGALFVDARYDYAQVQRFFAARVQPYFEDMALYDTFANKHPVTFAANLLALHFACRDWRCLVQEAPDLSDAGMAGFGSHVAAGFMVHGKVVGHGIAASGRYAKMAAARLAVRKLEGMSVDEFREFAKCDCKPGEEDGAEEREGRGTAV